MNQNAIDNTRTDGYLSYPANVNPHKPGSTLWVAWDNGYWAAHDESYVESTDGIESGYGDYFDMDAVSQGMYDDDPNPYDGSYSEM